MSALESTADTAYGHNFNQFETILSGFRCFRPPGVITSSSSYAWRHP